MGEWTHSICEGCWGRKFPGRRPVTVISSELVTCCFCGSKTGGGIYIRENPKNMSLRGCRGRHTVPNMPPAQA